MATDHATIEFLLDQLGGRGAAFSTKRMFGEYCLYREGMPVAFVCDDVLFVKDTPPGREAIRTMTTPEFGPPYPGAKLYLRLAPDAWDDGDWLRRVLDATAVALPKPKPPARNIKRGVKEAAAAVEPAKPDAGRVRKAASNAVRKSPPARK